MLIIVWVRRSKTDQEGAGRRIEMAYGQHPTTSTSGAICALVEVQLTDLAPMISRLHLRLRGLALCEVSSASIGEKTAQAMVVNGDYQALAPRHRAVIHRATGYIRSYDCDLIELVGAPGLIQIDDGADFSLEPTQRSGSRRSPGVSQLGARLQPVGA